MGKTDDLGSLGSWPAVKIDRRSHKIMRHAYDRVVDACARLASFSTGRPLATSGPINDRQEALAADDLVDFAVHARRLIENTAKQKRFSRVVVRSIDRTKSELQLTTVINTIIHHQDIEILRTEHQIRILTGHDIVEVMLSPDRAFPPCVSVKSDRGHVLMFDLYELIEMFQQRILQVIIDICDEQKFFLEGS